MGVLAPALSRGWRFCVIVLPLVLTFLTKPTNNMNPFPKLKALIDSLEEDFSKSYDKQTAAAGTRVRKGMQEVKDMAQDIRVEVQSMKNAEK